MNKFRKLLLEELRIVPITIAKDKTILNSDMVKAMTINEELNNLGYTLNPNDIIKLAKTYDAELDSFLDNFKNTLNDVKSKPMYPNFPTQVMKIDEAQFRFHQMVHYFSTYGMEELFGVEVLKGWLPDVEDTEKTVSHEKLLKSKVISLVESDKCISYALKQILSKRERMTIPEKEIVKHICNNYPDVEIDTDVAFKENLYDIFYISTIQYNNYTLARKICQHTGDIWKCISYIINSTDTKRFKTSQKRKLVQLLESYPIEDFEANLILSNKKAEGIKNLLNYLSYNRFSNSYEHKEAVRKLRNSELKSWEGQAKTLIFSKDSKALQFIASRPGMMLRMITLLLRNGYDSLDIISTINAEKLSTQTLLSLIGYFTSDPSNMKYDGTHRPFNESNKVAYIAKELLCGNLKAKDTILKNKSVYLDMDEYDLDNSLLLSNDKSDEGGYMRSGLAYKIPENIKYLRFFVYWNDRFSRVDIDLHASLINAYGYIENIGWDSDYTNGIAVFSGDITHSDAAEFIDINIDNAIENGYKYATCNINSYTRQKFKDIDTCFVGLMGVNNLNENVVLYDAKNCFFSHELKGDYETMFYGYIDIQNRNLTFIGKPGDTYGNIDAISSSKFRLQDYINTLLQAQECSIVDDKNDADIVLVMGKPNREDEVSFIDNNFFLD